jgi:hypothetical protein
MKKTAVSRHFRFFGGDQRMTSTSGRLHTYTHGMKRTRLMAVLLALGTVIAGGLPVTAMACTGACATCKTECKDSHTYCISHPEECGHGKRTCTEAELAEACDKKYGDSCMVQCDPSHKSGSYPSEDKCSAECKRNFERCKDDGYRVSACDRKYGESCKANCG